MSEFSSNSTGEPFEDRPIFQKASTLIPMEQVKELFNNLVCGNRGRKGCQVQLDFPNLYYCRVCMAMQSLGTEFEKDDKRITDNMIEKMQPWQHKGYNDRAQYNQKWLDNYPRGATGI